MKSTHRTRADLEARMSAHLANALASAPGPVDVLDVLDNLLMTLRERVLTRAYPQLLDTDPSFFEDPNPIVRHTHPSVDLTPGHTGGPITPADLARRNPTTPADFDKLQRATVGFVGCGGIQLCAELLTRGGVGHLIIADHDVMESTNANRQAFCTEETLGLNKAHVAARRLQGINSAVDVTAHAERITEAALPQVFAQADVLVDGSGDAPLRTALHQYARRAVKPLVTWAWAGWEGQCMTFLPNDPLYYDVFGFSPYSNARGFDVAGLCVLNGHVARDVVNLLLGNHARLSCYPYLTTFSSFRRHFSVVRDVRAIRERHASR